VGALPSQRRWYLGGTETVRGERPDTAQSGKAFWLTRAELGKDMRGFRPTMFADLGWVGDRTKMAMPETAIGLFPDVGGSWFLSHAPGKVGLYLGLVGPTLRAADAIYCGLADLYVGAGPLPVSELETLRPAIDEHFGSFDGFRKHFTANALGVQGSGWSVDMWEHAFYLQYRNVKPDYVEAWWNVVNWADAARRFAHARSIMLP